MSSIHNLVILCEGQEAEVMAELNAWVKARDPEREQQFEQVNVLDRGGIKFMTCTVYAMAANHVAYVGDLRDALPCFPWDAPGAVVLWDLHEYADGVAEVSRAGFPS